MDGQIIEFDPSLNRGVILGEDKGRYEFATADWHSAGQPQRGEAVRFVDHENRASQIFRLPPPYVASLTAGVAIEAVYRVALGRAASEDAFAAPVRWTSFIVPALIFVVLRALQMLFGGDLGVMVQQGRLTFLSALLMLVVLVIATLITLAIAAGVAALIGRGVGQPGRVARGVLAFVWMQAVLLQPGIAVTRLLLEPRDPTAVVVLLAAAIIVLVIGAGRVVSAGFRSGGTGSGVIIVIAAGAASWLIDKLLGTFT